MESARKEAFIVHAVTSAEPAAGSSKRPEVMPYILDEEALERRRSRRIVWGRAAVAVLVFWYGRCSPGSACWILTIGRPQCDSSHDLDR